MKKKNFNKLLSPLYVILFLSGTCLVSCGDDDDDNPAINEAPTSSFSVQSEGIVGEEIQFTDNSSDADGSIVSWEWDFGDGNSSTSQNPVHAYTEAGTYEVTLIVTDNGELTNSASFSILIDAEELVPTTGLINRTLAHNSISREYALYIPSTYSGDSEVPLVVYLHGAPENKEVAQATTDFTNVAEAEGFIMVYAEAASGSNDSYIWADGRAGNADAAFDDVSFINFLVDELTTEFEINANKRYLCGFSNGGFLSQHIANQDNTRFAAIATVSASLHQPYETTGPGRAIPMLYMYGTSDPVALYSTGAYTNQAFNVGGWTVPVIGVEAAVNYWVGINACNTTPTETNLSDTDAGDNSTVTVLEYTGGTNDAKVKFYRINGGGHTWPGVASASRPSTPFGATNNDIKAGQEIWNFFNEFELN